MELVSVLNMHLPVVSGSVNPDGAGSVTKPFVYGTAFPLLAGGVLATAGHVLEGALADGEPFLTMYHPNEKGQLPTLRVTRYELFKGIDFALLECPALAKLPPIPVSFEELGFWDQALTLGFPYAVDGEYVSVVPRSFRGHIVTRRELLHLKPGQPAGYELSFPTPKGTSGAPLLGGRGGELTCRGYIVQQSTLGSGDDQMTVGLAVASDAWLSINSKMLGRPLAEMFGLQLTAPPPRSEPRLPGGIAAPEDLDKGWPDDPPEDEGTAEDVKS